MPAASTLIAFAAASFAILVIPGPSVGFVVARSVEHGRLAGLWSVFGLETGAALHVLAAALGLTALVASSGTPYFVVHWAGVGYLAWLGIRELRSVRSVGAEGAPVLQTVPCLRRLYRDAVLVDLLNPKTALFFLAFLPQFIDQSRGPVSGQVVILGLLFVGLAALCDGTYAVVAARLSGRLRSTAQARRIRIAAGSVYLGLAGLAVVA